jgi:hypothetical protein
VHKTCGDSEWLFRSSTVQTPRIPQLKIFLINAGFALKAWSFLLTVPKSGLIELSHTLESGQVWEGLEMTIASSAATRRFRGPTGLESFAGGVLIAAAIFTATPKSAKAQDVYDVTGGTSTNPNSVSALSWFNTTNWNIFGTTGFLPESLPPSDTGIDIDANNAVMPTVGVVFDPRDDSNTPGGQNTNYIANTENLTGFFYVAGITSNGTEPAAPNKLTVESGTIIAVSTTIGRDSPGILAMNGGTFISSQNLLIQGDTPGRTFLGTGTLEYHGGNVETGWEIRVGSQSSTSGVSLTSAGVGSFIIYNDGPDGAILAQNGFAFGSESNGAGTVGIAEFHYDLNTGGIGGTRPLQANWTGLGGGMPQQGILQLFNGTNQSSRLNLVLDAVPSIIGGEVQNLGLFDETLITGQGTYPRAFYSVDGTTLFTQGATISATYGTNTYSWTISYSGQINFTNTATSAYNPTGIRAAGGNDIVLIGLPIPEPSSLTLLGSTSALILSRRRRRKNGHFA